MLLDEENNSDKSETSELAISVSDPINNASLFKRVLAYLIDLLLFASAFIYFYNLAYDVDFYTFFINKEVFIWSTVSAIVLYQFYFFILEYFWNGKTVGKYFLNVKVILINGTKIKFVNSLIRNFARIITFLPPLFFIPDLVCIFISKNHRSVADLLAGTVVVNSKANNNKLKKSYLEKEEKLD